MKIIRWISISALLAAVITLGGCGDSSGGGSGGDSTTGSVQGSAESVGVIGLSVLTMANPFFIEIAEAMETEAAKYDYEVRVVSGDNDAATQQNQVNDFIVQQVSAIVLTPCDSKAVGEAIRKANEAGIPVFTADIACLAEDAEVVAHIATDNEAGGRQAAKAMLEALDGNGKVAIIDHPEVESVLLRTRGFREELKAMNAEGVEIVGAWPGKGLKDVSFSVAQDILQAHPDLDGIFAINDPSALGAVAAIEKAGKAGEIQVVGFDGMPEGKQAIKAGKIYADPVQFPDQIGAKTIEAIMDYFNGEEVPSEILIPTGLYGKAEALEDPTLQ